ncbi:MAG: septum formation protein Maf [Candidatus Hydrogenedentes bacterium]|nr:septum formation protein Maf [Candidatus Hydrogenedentota bacterium]
MRIVLASASPRRKELLDAVGLRFDVVASAVDEDGHEGNASRHETVMRNAAMKARDVAAGIDGDAIVIGADTLVFAGDHVFGKPGNMDEAKEMLGLLNGRTHQVITGVAVVRVPDGVEVTGHEITDVTFRRLSSREIERYLDKIDPHDRAGAYTVDGAGSLLVERFAGCFYNVLGLPLVRLDIMLRQFGISLFD